MPNVVLIKHRRNWGLDEAVVRERALMVLEELGQKNAELSLMFVGRQEAKKLNIKYRQMDYVPQVLAFPMEREGMLGDVVICTPKFKREKANLDDWLKHGIGNLLKKY